MIKVSPVHFHQVPVAPPLLLSLFPFPPQPFTGADSIGVSDANYEITVLGWGSSCFPAVTAEGLCSAPPGAVVGGPPPTHWEVSLGEHR